MRVLSSTFESRLRRAAILLLSLPAIVAAACFAHGHGALPPSAFLATLFVCIAAGATSGVGLLRHIKRFPSIAARIPAAANHS